MGTLLGSLSDTHSTICFLSSSQLMALRRQTLNSVYSALSFFRVMSGGGRSGGRADPEWPFLRVKLGSAAVR